MKRKHSFTTVPSKKAFRYPSLSRWTGGCVSPNQGVLTSINHGGRELKLLFNMGKRLVDLSKVPPLGTAIIDGDNYNLIMFRTDNGSIICMKTIGDHLCHNHNDYQVPAYHTYLLHDKEGYSSSSSINPHLLQSDHLFGISFSLCCSINYTPNHLYTDNSYGEIIFGVNRHSYNQFIIDMIPKVFLLKEMCGSFGDIITSITQWIRFLWKNEWKKVGYIFCDTE